MLVPIELTHPQGEMYSMLKHRVPFPLFVGGYGCGKSEILTTNAIRDVMEFVGCKVGCYAPTHDLLSLNLIPRIETRLDELGIKHSHDKKKHILNIQGARQIIFRSMDNPKRIVAYEVYRSHVDEADLMATAQKGADAWNRIIARNRQRRTLSNGKTHPESFNQVSGYTTPEGFKFTYKRWKKEPGEGYKFVTAATSSNWTLDESFIKNLEATYTPEQCKAYLQGLWTNIFTGSVYSYFDRDRHRTRRTVRPQEPLIVGCDFNYGGSCNTVYVPMAKRPGLLQVDELVSQDTEQMVENLQQRYEGHQITCMPDASGNKHQTNASVSDIAMLKQADFVIKANSTNPRIVDRINSVQRLLYNGLFGINPDTCPKTVEAMEEHAYNEKTGLPDKVAGSGTVDDRNDAMGYPCAFLYPIKKTKTKRLEL